MCVFVKWFEVVGSWTPSGAGRGAIRIGVIVTRLSPVQMWVAVNDTSLTLALPTG